MNKFEQIAAKRDEYKAMVKTMGKEAVSEALKSLFEDHPSLTAVSWTQYTPYFNDGEPCEFGVHSLSFRTTETAEDAEDDEGNEGWDYIPYGEDNQTDLTRALKKFAKLRDEDIMLECFGDHVQVTATRDGVEVEEYSHD